MPDKLKDTDFIAYLKNAISTTDWLRSDIADRADIGDDYYSCEPRGDEIEGFSTFISSQFADLVDSDMPTLVRIFLGAGKTVEFMPCNETSKEDAREASNKTRYVERLITGTGGYYRTMLSVLMGVTMHPVSVMRYGLEEKKTVRVKEHKGITALVMAKLDEEYRAEFDKVEIIEQEIDEDEMQEGGEPLYEIKYRLTKKEDPIPYLRRVAPSQFRISPGATGKEDARIIGEDIFIRRGDLVAMGHDKELVAQIPITQTGRDEELVRRTQEQSEWASEVLCGFDGFFRCDYDGDGIIELRKVLIFGDILLENEEIDNDPRGINFAFCSATMLPDNVIGMGRGERAIPYQDAITNMSRAMLDNTAQLTRGRSLVNTSAEAGVNYYDLMGNGNIIRYAPTGPVDPTSLIYPVPVQPVATEALTVIQFLDSQRAQATGSLMANQGLKADTLYKETATRFQGVDDSAQAKVELLVRNIAEVLIKDLYEGMAYYAQKHRLKALEVKVLGEEMKINPGEWMIDHRCGVTVGTGYGDNEKTLATLASLLQVMGTLQGTGIVDAKKMYNLLVKMAHAGGLTNVSDYLNDPEVKQETLMAENEQLKAQLAQLQQQIGDATPLMQIEQMKAQVSAISKQLDMAFKEKDLMVKTALELTKLEAAEGKQLDSEFTQNESTVQ